jgi:hypothetical protein
MSENYTAQQMEQRAKRLDEEPHSVKDPETADMLRQAAQMMREREREAVKVTDEPAAWMRGEVCYREGNGRQDGEKIITEHKVFPTDIPLYTARRAPVPDGWKRWDGNNPPPAGRYAIWDKNLVDPSRPHMWTYRPVERLEMGRRWGQKTGSLQWFNEHGWAADRPPSYYRAMPSIAMLTDAPEVTK